MSDFTSWLETILGEKKAGGGGDPVADELLQRLQREGVSRDEAVHQMGDDDLIRFPVAVLAGERRLVRLLRVIRDLPEDQIDALLDRLEVIVSSLAFVRQVEAERAGVAREVGETSEKPLLRRIPGRCR